MTITDLIRLFRQQVSDETQPLLWSPEEVFAYLVDAQDMFVRLTGGIADFSTPAIVLVPVVANVPMSKHSPHILRVLSASLVTAKRKIAIKNQGDLAQMNTTDYGLVVPTSLDDSDTGDVHTALLGMEDNKIRWLKVPSTSDTCKLHVRRLPYPRLKDEDSCLEIDEQHHIHLLKWMKHMAYSKQDAETYDKGLAEANEQAFRSYCEDAKVEIEGKRYKPRVVQYGGI